MAKINGVEFTTGYDAIYNGVKGKMYSIYEYGHVHTYILTNSKVEGCKAIFYCDTMTRYPSICSMSDTFKYANYLYVCHALDFADSDIGIIGLKVYPHNIKYAKDILGIKIAYRLFTEAAEIPRELDGMPIHSINFIQIKGEKVLMVFYAGIRSK